jgi:uncharacterized protein YdaU (DUF1376 family)
MTYQGHNSAAYGEQLRDELETVLSDDHETIFHYAQWHINDYVTGTTGMTLEHEGAYIRFLMRLYQRGKPLPDDDRFMATCMALSVRVWRRVKETLVKFGKIIQRNGCLTNPRFEKERQKRAEQMRKQAEAARNRWARERAEKAKNAKSSPNFAGTFAKLSIKVSQKTRKKAKEINLLWITTHMLTNNQYPITNIRFNPHSPLKRGRRGRKKLPSTRLPDDWSLPEEWREWARAERRLTDFQIDRLAEQFHRYWTGPDAKNGGYKKDWKATWQNNVDMKIDRGTLPKPNGYANGHTHMANGEIPETVRKRMEAELARKNGGGLL